MTNNDSPTRNVERIHWMDNLRTMVIFLVVLYHVGGVYEAAGLWSWFWIVADPALQSHIPILSESAARTLEHLLSHNQPKQPKLVMVSACAVYLQLGLFASC